MTFGKPEPFPWQQGARVVREAREALVSGTLANFGIPDLDDEIRGLRPGDLVIVAGPPHGFKTQMTVSMALRNPETNIVWCSPDEQHEFVLEKFIRASRGLSHQEYEELIVEDPSVFDEEIEAIQEHIAICEHADPENIKLVVQQMRKAKGSVDVMVFDYVEELEVGMDVKTKMAWLKKFGRVNKIAVVAIHQSVKMGLDLTQTPNLGMMSEAGHKEAFVVVWMKRPGLNMKDRVAVLQDETLGSVECWLLKNKRGRTLHHPIICAIEDGDLLVQWGRKHDRIVKPDVFRDRLR